MMKLLKYVAGVIAAVPGLGVLLGAFPFPHGLRVLFGGVAAAVPALLVLGLMTFWRQLRGLDPRILTRWAGGMLAVFLVALVVFLGVHGRCVIVTTEPAFDPKPILFPLHLTGEVGAKVENRGGRLAFVNEFGPDTAQERIAAMPWSGLLRWFTVAVMLVLFVTSVTALAASFALLGLHLTAPGDAPISLPAFHRKREKGTAPPAASQGNTSGSSPTSMEAAPEPSLLPNPPTIPPQSGVEGAD
jgi:hypothetical protein